MVIKQPDVETIATSIIRNSKLTLVTYDIEIDKGKRRGKRRIRILHRFYDSTTIGTFGDLRPEGLFCVYQGQRLIIPRIDALCFGEFKDGKRVFYPIELNYHTPESISAKKDKYEFRRSKELRRREKDIHGAFCALNDYKRIEDESIRFQGNEFDFSEQSLVEIIKPYYAANYPRLMQGLEKIEEQKVDGEIVNRTLMALVLTGETNLGKLIKDKNNDLTA